MKNNFMKPFTAKFHIAVGQTFIVCSIVLSALYLGLIPDQTIETQKNRVAIAEIIAVNSSAYLSQKDIQRFKANLEMIVARNNDVHSAALKNINNKTILSIGDHKQLWKKADNGYSTDSQFIVPIWSGKQKWGNIELKFTSLEENHWIRLFSNTKYQLIAFIAFSCFMAFYFYLSKMLRHLDPSQAIPDRVRSALDTLTEGLLIIDSNKYIVLANEAFATLVDKKTDTLIGQSATALNWVANENIENQSIEYPWEEAISEGINIKNRMIHLMDGDNNKRRFLVNCSLVLGNGNKKGGVLISFQDVTELEKKEIELKKSKNIAEAANLAKSEFLANMSHEIRTPMNAILGFTEVLRRGYGEKSTDPKKHLDTIYSSGQHLLELINDILDLSKVESGQLEIESVACAPHTVINDIINVLSVRAKEKNIYLKLIIETAIPETFLSDPSRLRQIITNLVGNAIKFTDTGGVTVTLSAHKNTDKTKLQIKIIDTGIGIIKEKFGSIFDPFVQADTSITRRFGGTGLGLAISNKFAKALGGEIVVTSEFNQGSIFTVNLESDTVETVNWLAPNKVFDEIQQAQTQEKVDWTFPSSTVLVVDDGEENRELVKLVLLEFGLNVDTAENGLQAYEQAINSDYDIILMDVQMPIMDGFTAVKKMRDYGIQCPVIALTAHAMKGFDNECRAVGYSDYLPKPIIIDNLIALLAHELNAEQKSLSPKPASTSKIYLSIPKNLENLETITSKWAKNEKFHSIVINFITHLEHQIQIMEKAQEENDFIELANLAHWLKGSGATVGFDELTNPAKNLEYYAKEKQEKNTRETISWIKELSKKLEKPSLSESSAKSKIQKIQKTFDTFNTNSLFDENQPIISKWANNEKFHPIIINFIDRLKIQITEMETAWQAKDYSELQLLAHRLKGAGGTVGFDELTEPATELEQFSKGEQEIATKEIISYLKKISHRLKKPEINTRAKQKDEMPL